MRVVFLSDLHVGHGLGLADPAISGNTASGAPVRERLFDFWRKSCKGKWRKPDALVCLGDAVDGQGHIRGGVEQWTTDLVKQSDHAAELLKLWNARRYYIIRGSNYHVEPKGTGFQVEEHMARTLGAEPYPSGKGQLSGWQWFLTFDGVTVHVAHKIGVSRVFAYRSTPIAREMMHAKLNDPMRHVSELLQKEMTEFKTRIVMRGHAHYYWHCATSHSAGFNLPCWQALTPFMELNNPLAMPPDIGFLGIEFKNGAYVYESPQIRVEAVQPPAHTIVGR